MRSGARKVPKKVRFPDAYTNLAQTTLTIEVKPRMGPVTFDVKK